MNNWARNSVGKYAPIGATADDLPLAPPSGKKTITANGNDIDVSSYATADVNVPNPSTGKKTITTTAEVDVTSYATAQVVDANLTAGNIKKDTAILGITGSYEGGGGIPAPAITATFVISDYSDVALLETYIVEEIEGSYQQITLTEVTQETTVITGLVFPVSYSDYSIRWAFTPSCSDGNDPYNVSVSDTVNCVADEFGGIEVTDNTQPCSATFTFTKGS